MMICRERESQILQELYSSDRPEFLALYGRRRVGKTYLIREFFESKPAIFMVVTGSKEGKQKEQIKHFTKGISEAFYKGIELKAHKNWDETFELLTKAIDDAPTNRKIVLFFDEFPWMATPRSRLLENLDYYWNHYWSRDRRVKLILCGSAASWIIKNIINNKAGLHNRLTYEMLLEPFNLHNTKRFLLKQGVRLNNKQTLKIFMVTGGVPYYLGHIKKGLSATQNIEKIAFMKNGVLVSEFDKLYSSLFKQHELCIEIIRIIASRRYGYGQEELFEKIDANLKGKKGLAKLKELEDSGFIISFKPYKHKKKGIYYRVIDEYTLFYLKWIEPIKDSLLKRSMSIGYWDKQEQSPSWQSWSGLAFESVCYKHLNQIRQALSLPPTAIPATWRYTPLPKSKMRGAQIDLLFDRDDDAVTIADMKLSNTPFVVDKKFAENIANKAAVFKKRTRTQKQIFIALISANGLKPTMYSEEMIDAVVTMDDLFKDES